MEEIKVGEYIRTKGGNIGQVLKVIPESKYTTRIGRIAYSPEKYWIDTRKGSMSKPYIKKHSSNIIDLIEEGDYVNGEKVLCFRNIDCDYDIGTEYNDEFGVYYGYDKEQIKDVVTKEQFEQMKYIVGDE